MIICSLTLPQTYRPTRDRQHSDAIIREGMRRGKQACTRGIAYDYRRNKPRPVFLPIVPRDMAWEECDHDAPCCPHRFTEVD